MTAMKVAFAAATDVGRQRKHNEDNFLVDEALGLFIVADGMGGHAAGEVASSIAVHQVRDAVHENRDILASLDDANIEAQTFEILQMLEHAIQASCAAVYAEGQADPDKRGMGTTISVLLVGHTPTQARGFIAHVGDSRIYLTRNDQCHQLTDDHSLIEELIRRGKVDRDSLDSSPYRKLKNAVTRAVGVYESVEVDTLDLEILEGDRFLLCSDGLHAYLEESEIPELLSHGAVNEVPPRLVRQANDGGGHDNITAVVVRAGEQSESPRAEQHAMKVDALESVPLFRYLDYRELVRVINITNTREYPQGAKVYEADQQGDGMYVVMEGMVELSRDGMPIAKLGRGQHFGEVALIDRTVRSTTATTAEASRLLHIQGDAFYALIKEEPGLAVKLLWSFVQVLGRRLRDKNDQVAAIMRERDDSGE